jgi:glucosylglycerol-phosphate synthase
MAQNKKSPFVIVYHRQPYEEAVENGRTVYRENKSPNGIVPALKGFFSTAKDAVWVACTGCWADSAFASGASHRRLSRTAVKSISNIMLTRDRSSAR